MKTLFRVGRLSCLWFPLAGSHYVGVLLSFKGREYRYRFELGLELWWGSLEFRWWNKNADRWERRT